MAFTRAPELVAVLAALACAATLSSHAQSSQSSQAQLVVRVTVPRHATIRLDTPRALTISEADVARGYVDVESPVELTVHSNVAEGYALFFHPQGGSVRQAVLQGLGGELRAGEAGAVAVRPAAGRGLWRDTLRLHVRFELSPAARAGTVPWPLQISMVSQ